MTETKYYAEGRNDRADKRPIAIYCEYHSLGAVPTKQVVKYGQTSSIWPITDKGVMLLATDGIVPRVVERADGSKFLVFTISYK